MTGTSAPGHRPPTIGGEERTSIVLTPTLRQSAKRGLFWIVVAVFLVALAVGALLLNGASSDAARLSPNSAGPEGTRALVEVLRQQGVDVTTTTSLRDTLAAIGDAQSTTLAVYDSEQYLADDGKNADLASIAADLILLDPSFDALATLAPGVSAAGTPDSDPLEAGCDVAAAEVAGTVTAGGTAYRVADGTDVTTCLRSDSPGADDAFSLVRLGGASGTVTIVGATDALTNAQIRARGNAAFALTLFGENPSLVFYLPSAADLDQGLDPADVTPAWLAPLIGLFLLTVIAAGIWRGRRFGPLIIENLPVDVKSSETMEGRARLYERGSARLRALDALRMGSVARLARQVGLPLSATVDEVAARVAEVTRGEPRSIRSLLVDSEPTNDRELVALSDGLSELEARVATSMRA